MIMFKLCFIMCSYISMLFTFFIITDMQNANSMSKIVRSTLKVFMYTE